ncbi:DNA adenine methylase [Paludibacter sp. 221]|uniref:DNA adenine methylase n=1 Tax=Paludibacter sp. 221 TaxID=2302939 RepID=UPI0013D1A8AE|nr:DNA adenine methylase [Paludibacter sp. 221]NDV45520.1 DNA adenine methylase [Paludibacter sp. 221]
MKNYNSAPLPFQGQKRYFLKSFKQCLKSFKNIAVVVDLFGGSGLLSHAAKEVLPNARVIYNDYDGFSTRLNNVERTNELLSYIRVILSDTPREKRINDTHKNAVLSRIEQAEKSGFVDYITLSSSLLFSANYVNSFDELKASTLYNNVKQSDYNATNYLKGLEVVKYDYLELYNQYKNIPGVLFILDPPYLTTDTKTYLSNQYWKLADFLNVINVLNESNYIFFTSNKSSLVELCEWLKENHNINNPFENAMLKTQEIQINRNTKYIDMMFVKQKAS